MTDSEKQEFDILNEQEQISYKLLQKAMPKAMHKDIYMQFFHFAIMSLKQPKKDWENGAKMAE